MGKADQDSKCPLNLLEYPPWKPKSIWRAPVAYVNSASPLTQYIFCYEFISGLPCGSVGKESACNEYNVDSILGWEDLEKGKMVYMEEGTEKNLNSGHMVYMTALMENTLMEITERLENHPQEVVILACRNFDGMMEDLHKYLMGCIKNISGDMLCPCEPEVLTLHQLWSQGLQVILLYKDKASMSQHEELDLIHYLELVKSCSHPDRCCLHTRIPGRLFLACINLTENLEFFWGLPYLCTLVWHEHPGLAPGCTNTTTGEFIWADGFLDVVIRGCVSVTSCDITGLNRTLPGG
ncbi:hypothetical protein R6Z07M_019748 [Ovis aries]